ncbi:MAG: hypothetical protein DME06_06935 [Candidatus Rokuibacteriota bacterium]|nr:MAG: hypothetical protein DME06_06935 [Candidatus Rokubacteria bacterium]
MQCPRCEQANPAEAQFCNHCGAPLRLRYSGCGTANPPESRFCNGCGRALAEAPPPGPPDAAPPPERADAPESAPVRSQTILVVEDRDDVRALARDILEEKGYRVLEAEDPNDALRIAEQHRAAIDLLLTLHVRLCQQRRAGGGARQEALQGGRPDVEGARAARGAAEASRERLRAAALGSAGRPEGRIALRP